MNRTRAFGLVVREARKEAQLSQEKLAEKAKLHRNFVGLLERNATTAALDSIFALADALQIPASELIARAEQLAVLNQTTDS